MPTYSSNTYLSQYGAEMTANATYIYNYFRSRGWTKNAICAMLGNMQRESTINPGLWQNLDAGNTSLGLGLVQWTPATKLISWCNSNSLSYTSIEAQCRRIIYELNNGLQWIATASYPESFRQFTQSTKSINYLTYAFLKNYERAGVEAASQRVQHAQYWYNHLSGGSTGNTYTPRLTSDGMQGNIHWYSNGNPFYASGYGLPNCTCYAYGRFWEIGDPNNDGSNNPTGLPRGDAGTWYTTPTPDYEKGSEPQLGAIICYAGNTPGYSEAGHVAVVEVINDDGSIITSNSAYGGTYFFLQGENGELNPSNNYGGCQGFIYNPFGGGAPEPEPEYNKKKHYNFVLFNRRKREQQEWIRKRLMKR